MVGTLRFAHPTILEKLTGWTLELSPPKDSPLFQWCVLVGEVDRSGS